MIATQPPSGSISDLIDLGQLHRLRLENDTPVSGGFSYAAVGSNQWVNTWIDLGVREGLLSHSWRDELDRCMDMGRGEANRILLDALDRR